ncbi:uncharacterized protein PgNI_02671 [Pyricularia grisea]|uniref:Lysine-specific metallo-endopeptidase domain-containing protein n=1 Tax=Pyricularia grisea TaxID=148305 RepID=A0A6P8BEE3_PYRGI|nr:uncharacterized protein PgNI_02671 [Pyricularia grisea]TLD14119.1 hypothetical protein PgNI_02671 [Pyricularia grisea]
MFFSFIFIVFHTVAISASTNIGTSLHPVYNYNTIPSHIHGALKKRAYITSNSNCSDSEASKIHAALKSCAQLASWGFHAVQSNNQLFKLIFKTDSTDIQDLVKSNFNEIYRECSRETDEVSITCRDIGAQKCVRDGVHALGYARIPYKQVIICPTFFNKPASSREATAGNQDTVILHEIAHIVLDTYEDYGYEWEGISK